ncbi:MAG: hypothetical protein A2Y65_09755 [Deltaproteobacteria bacterium RBG_13_52_11]|nr:MAG: hypothetical protein A2Y65_09755 [Deltaproteobacteria bacterium RBG_13_52_11]
MNKEKIITLTNRLSMVAIILLMYWVFIFVSISVFGFKVFKENITESFYLSIVGILALLAGAVIVNIMFNMTIISESLSKKKGNTVKKTKKKKSMFPVLFISSFPVIFLFLYLGDVRTSAMKEKFLVNSAQYMISNNQQVITELGEYHFDFKYVKIAGTSFKMLSKEDESFPSVSLIIQDTIGEKEVFLRFTDYHYDDKKTLNKADYIYPCSKDEREYLRDVFNKGESVHRFSASDGFYELYFPVKTNNRLILLYFTDRKTYGKLGS